MSLDIWRSILHEAVNEQYCCLQRRSGICSYLIARSRAHPSNFLNELERCKTALDAMFDSTDTEEILLAVQAVEDTLEIKSIVGDDFLKRCFQLLCQTVKISENERVSEGVALAIGSFVSKSGFSNNVEDQVQWAFQKLEGMNSTGYERRNAVLVLRSIAEQAPAAFNVHVQKFLNLIWKGLRSLDKHLRIASARAVDACLCVIEQRKTRNRVIWFYRLADEALKGLRSGMDARIVHGSLMVISKLFQYSGEFMLARYETVAKNALLPRLDGDHNVKMAILELIPLLAEFCPERFVQEHLSPAMNVVLSHSRDLTLRDIFEENAAGFRALSGLALTLKNLNIQMHLMRWIHEIAEKLEQMFDGTVEASYKDALECCGILATCLKSEWKVYAERLLLPMVSTGVSQSLATCLQQTLENVPELATTIHERLLDAIYLLLIGIPLTDTLQPEMQDRLRSRRSPATVGLALSVLSVFDFGDRDFLPFAQEHICNILANDPSCHVRASAASACIRIAKKHAQSDGIKDLLNTLVEHGIGDRKEVVRNAVWEGLLDSPQLDQVQLESEAARKLHLGLGDPSLRSQLTILKLMGRLIISGGDFLVAPALEVMSQLMHQLDLNFDKGCSQLAAEALSQLIQSCPSVVIPKADHLASSLIHVLKHQLRPKIGLSDVSSEERRPRERSFGAVAAALETVGHLAECAGSVIDEASLDTLLELTAMALKKPEIGDDAIPAVQTLGKIVSSTGHVDQPYKKFSWLLTRLLDMLQVDDPDARTAVTRTLGVLCAIDPGQQRRSQAQASGEGRLEREGVRPVVRRNEADKATPDLLTISRLAVNSEESYSLFAMNALLKILKNHSLSAFHRDAIRVLGSITDALSVSSVQYLNILVPNWCEAVYSGDEEMKHYILQQFIRLISVVKQHIRHYLKHLMKLVKDLWTVNCHKETLCNLLHLLKEVAPICKHDLDGYLSWLVPRMILLLETASWDIVPTTVETIVALGPSLRRHLHQILPKVAKLLRSPCMQGREHVQLSILSTLEALSRHLQVPELTGGIMVEVIRTLKEMEEMDKTRVDDVISAVLYAARPDDQILKRVIAIAHGKGIKGEKLDILVERMQSLDGKMEGSWRRLFEPSTTTSEELPGESSHRGLRFSDQELSHVWNADQRHTYQDWLEWMRVFSLELLKCSPSPSLRACYEFAQNIPSMAKDLFSASFVSFWSELMPNVQRDLIRHLEAAMASMTIPPEILTSWLNLAEFMEHNNYQLPLDKRALAALSMKCQAFAKALHYKEMEFQDNPEGAVEILLAIYNQCYLPAAADGLLAYARDVLHMEIMNSWYEKLHQWEKALVQYEQRIQETEIGIAQSIETNLGCMRCYSALWDWPNLNVLCQDQWDIADPSVRKQIAPLAAQAAWKMGKWQEMSYYLEAVDVEGDDVSDASTCAFLLSVNKIRLHQFEAAQECIDKARQHLSADLAALSGESYERAYEKMVRVQQLAELEDVMQYIQSQEQGDTHRTQHIIACWKTRLEAVQKRADVWESCLSIRSLVLSPEEDILTWMQFAAMCRKQDKADFAKSLLLELLGYDPMELEKTAGGYGGGSGKPEVMFGFLKHLFGTSEGSPDLRLQAMDRLSDMIQKDDLSAFFAPKSNGLNVCVPAVPLISRAYVALAKWRQICWGNALTQDRVSTLIETSYRACEYAQDWAKAWREWAVYHLIAVEYYSAMANDLASSHVAPAVHGFFKALELSQDSALQGGMLGSGPSKDTYQDILRLLTLWFSHGNAPNVIEELTEGFRKLRIETWIVVIPQIIARIHVRFPHVQELIHQLIKKIGQAHPQALIYPILVASYSASGERRAASLEALELMRQMYPRLVNEAELIGRRFVDIAVFWDEKWHESLEEASKYYFNENDVRRMLDVLLPLHRDLQTNQATTNSEQRFVANYAEQLNEAYGLLQRYEEQEDDTIIQKAWDIYYSVFRKIDRNIRDMMVLHLSDVAPDLLDCGISVAIPGTYSPFRSEQVCIERIVPEIQVLNTKQRPRKLTIEGNDGNSYVFLLKGHEDLRQDERVMQLFGLVNTILASNFEASERELSIARYAVTPLSPNVGLIGWVPNCDTLHALIKEYREVKGIPINTEHQMMKNLAPNCENLTLIQKVEVFRHALEGTAGDDLKNIMWMKSSSSEHWLAHRTNYIRSCAVMSIVGYLLGLGDRHPSNLMIDRYTGKLVHIDFGDCFEAGMNREKFPERVPFRLTRMMVKAMEVAGIEGTFRKTCELVMHVMRAEKLTVMAMLEAFVYDPLINWRLMQSGPNDQSNLDDEGQKDIPSCLVPLYLWESRS